MSAPTFRARPGWRAVRRLGQAACALAAAGCSTPVLYSHVAPERARAAYVCTARELQNRGYLVQEKAPGSKLLARRDEYGPRAPSLTFGDRLLEGIGRREQVIVATLQSPSPFASALTIGPEDSERPAGALNDSRAVLAACAPAAPLVPGGLKCVGHDRPLTTDEEIMVATADAGALQGRAAGLAGDTLTLVTASGQQRVQLGTISALERRVPVARRDVSQRRVLLGTAIGVAAGLIGAAVTWDQAENASGSKAWNMVWGGFAWVLAAPLAGAGAGWLSAAVLPDPVWRWQAIPVETCR